MLTFIMATTILGVCSTNWTMVWVCLEVNTLAMCWLISKDLKTEKIQEHPTFMYYLIQVMASIIMILATNMEQSMASSMGVIFMLLMKMGAWPVHGWYMKLISAMEMKQMSLLIVMTWQKILPVALLMSMSENTNMKLILLSIALVTLVSPLAQLTKNLTFKSILALSSLNNNGWLIVSAMASMSTFSIFLLLYSATLTVTLKAMKSMTMKSMSMAMPFWGTTMLVSNMGGLPPLTMFWSKVLVVKTMMVSTLPTEMALVLMITACYLLYHYLWATLNEISWSPMKTQNPTLKEKSSKIITMIMVTSTMGVATLMYLGPTKNGFILMG